VLLRKLMTSPALHGAGDLTVHQQSLEANKTFCESEKDALPLDKARGPGRRHKALTCA